jgi:hypothetical protein
MTREEHFRRAEDLAAKAGEYLGQGDGQDTAAVWAAVAQVHAMLAIAAAISPGPASTTRPSSAIPEAGSQPETGVATRTAERF